MDHIKELFSFEGEIGRLSYLFIYSIIPTIILTAIIAIAVPLMMSGNLPSIVAPIIILPSLIAVVIVGIAGAVKRTRNIGWSIPLILAIAFVTQAASFIFRGSEDIVVLAIIGGASLVLSLALIFMPAKAIVYEDEETEAK